MINKITSQKATPEGIWTVYESGEEVLLPYHVDEEGNKYMEIFPNKPVPFVYGPSRDDFEDMDMEIVKWDRHDRIEKLLIACIVGLVGGGLFALLFSS